MARPHVYRLLISSKIVAVIPTYKFSTCSAKGTWLGLAVVKRIVAGLYACFRCRIICDVSSSVIATLTSLVLQFNLFITSGSIEYAWNAS